MYQDNCSFGGILCTKKWSCTGVFLLIIYFKATVVAGKAKQNAKTTKTKLLQKDFDL